MPSFAALEKYRLKPRVFFSSGVWACEQFCVAMGTGPTPPAAYCDFVRQLDFVRHGLRLIDIARR